MSPIHIKINSTCIDIVFTTITKCEMNYVVQIAQNVFDCNNMNISWLLIKLCNYANYMWKIKMCTHGNIQMLPMTCLYGKYASKSAYSQSPWLQSWTFGSASVKIRLDWSQPDSWRILRIQWIQLTYIIHNSWLRCMWKPT
jgi:hypothetical protein